MTGSFVRPFASILIDTCNHERCIERAIISSIDQDFCATDREIVVVDDGSTDRTREIVRKFEGQVRVLGKANGGQASAFNLGIPECRGEIIAFLDGDDWWAPEKLKRVVEIFAADSEVGMVGHAIVESFEGVADKVVALKQSESLRLSTVHAAQVFRLHRAYLGTSRLTLRAEIARRILPVPEGLVFEADEYLFTLAGLLADFVILNEALTYYRIHGANFFVAADPKSGGLRRKQRVMAALVAALHKGLPAHGASEQVVSCLLEIVKAEADQLRLMLDGGAPWETYGVEQTIFRIQHADASWKQSLFRQITTLPALVLPPRWFYAARGWVAGRAWYARTRKEFLPVPDFSEIEAPRYVRK